MKIALEGRRVGKKTVGRPRVMLLDWMLDRVMLLDWMLDKRSNWTYKHLKDVAHNRDAW